MELLLERRIEEEARKRLARYSRTQYYAQKHRALFTKRTGIPATVAAHALPTQWSFHKHFDPRYCINHARFIARGIWSSLQSGDYAPVPAIRTKVAKASGGFRYIDAFSIPDAVVAKIFLDNLRIRNAKIFSGSSFAYQINKAPLDAILRLKTLLSATTVFISQYDFSQFFDTIRHEYLAELLERDGPFLTTHMERCVLKAVMTHNFEEPGGASGSRTVGVPQGNSISLFLSNAAAHPLDMALERLNGAFARFADDAVIVNYTYEDALATAEAYHAFSRESGVQINLKKSSGIRIFSELPSELASVSRFDFLGYEFSKQGLCVGGRALASIKRRCSAIIYNHLILHVRRTGALNKKRLGPKFHDWDLVTCINEIRAYVYGGRAQSAIEEYLAGTTDIGNMTGAVSYFCLVEDGSIFRELDGWLHNALLRAYKARVRLIRSVLSKRQAPVTRDQFRNANWYTFKKIPMDTTVPSFHLAWRAARKSWSRHGLGGVDNTGMGYSY